MQTADLPRHGMRMDYASVATGLCDREQVLAANREGERNGKANEDEDTQGDRREQGDRELPRQRLLPTPPGEEDRAEQLSVCKRRLHGCRRAPLRLP